MDEALELKTVIRRMKLHYEIPNHVKPDVIVTISDDRMDQFKDVIQATALCGSVTFAETFASQEEDMFKFTKTVLDGGKTIVYLNIQGHIDTVKENAKISAKEVKLVKQRDKLLARTSKRVYQTRSSDEEKARDSAKLNQINEALKVLGEEQQFLKSYEEKSQCLTI